MSIYAWRLATVVLAVPILVLGGALTALFLPISMLVAVVRWDEDELEIGLAPVVLATFLVDEMAKKGRRP